MIYSYFKMTHFWKQKNRHISEPCELFKQILINNNIKFIYEIKNIVPNRNFSADILIPEIKTIIEINGQQHYESYINKDGFVSGKLKPYYQERHNLFSKEGYNIIEFHYSNVYRTNIVNNLILEIQEKLKNINYSIKEVQKLYIKQCKACKRDYDRSLATSKYCQICKEINTKIIKSKFFINLLDEGIDIKEAEKLTNEYLKKRKYPSKPDHTRKKRIKIKPSLKTCAICNKEFYGGTYCSPKCSYKGSQKVKRPSKEELEKLIWEKPTIQLGKDFNVSDKAIEKWTKTYRILKPPRGYWMLTEEKKKIIKEKTLNNNVNPNELMPISFKLTKKCLECNKEFKCKETDNSDKFCRSQCARKNSKMQTFKKLLEKYSEQEIKDCIDKGISYACKEFKLHHISISRIKEILEME